MSSEGQEGQSPRSGQAGRWLVALLPLALFLALAGLFYKQLAAGGASQDIPSALIGKPAPASELAPLEGLMEAGQQVPGIAADTFDGRYTLFNVWASWCAPCRLEHPLLVALGEEGVVQVAGLNYKDTTANALRFLGQLGNPYDAVGVDPNGRGAIEWGVYGVPETFLVDPRGTIIYKHVGPLSEQVLRERILPLTVTPDAGNGTGNAGTDAPGS